MIKEERRQRLLLTEQLNQVRQVAVNSQRTTDAVRAELTVVRGQTIEAQTEFYATLQLAKDSVGQTQAELNRVQVDKAQVRQILNLFLFLCCCLMLAVTLGLTRLLFDLLQICNQLENAQNDLAAAQVTIELLSNKLRAKKVSSLVTSLLLRSCTCLRFAYSMLLLYITGIGPEDYHQNGQGSEQVSHAAWQTKLSVNRAGTASSRLCFTHNALCLLLCFRSMRDVTNNQQSVGRNQVIADPVAQRSPGKLLQK